MINNCSNNLPKNYISIIYECGCTYTNIYGRIIENYSNNNQKNSILIEDYYGKRSCINCAKIIYWISYDNEDINLNKNSNIDCPATIDTKSVNEEIINLIENDVTKKEDSVEANNKETINLIENSKCSVCIKDFHDKTNTQILENTNISCSNTDIPSITPTDFTTNPNNMICKNVPKKGNNLVVKSNDIKINKKSSEKHTTNNNVNSVITIHKHPLLAFINNYFQGTHITVYTTASQEISGEVIFNYNTLLVLKSNSKTYYINPNEITYFS